MKDLGALMKQAQAMQAKLAEAQEKIAALTVVGSAGGGAVKVTMTGTNNLSRVEIDPDAMDDAETLADLIVAAHADARRQIEAQQQSLMAEAAGPMAGMNIPGLKF
ncbi:MAG TPA: YbaB/EbfC family nucleoid-associated protein [Caulobacteraceae bacterium]